MKIECNVIRDLIPLYKDEVCSIESKELVEEHLKQCRECREYMEKGDIEIQDANIAIDEKKQVADLSRKLKKMVLKKGICGMVISMMIFLTFSFVYDRMTSGVTDNAVLEVYAEIIDYNFAQMEKELSPEVLVSSNPYDYVNNKFYDEIVAIGFDAIEILEEKVKNGELSGWEEYVAAIAIQDIAGCDIYEITGTDWETVEQFNIEWDKLFDNIALELKKIVEDDSTDISEKCAQLQKYGVFAQPVINKIVKAKGEGNIEFNGEEISLDFNKDEVSKIEKISIKYKGAYDKKIEDYISKMNK